MQTKVKEKRNPKVSSNFISHISHFASKEGITLIALVITVIIMLILVGVSITLALNGGLFITAKQAKNKTQGEINVEQTLASGKIQIDGKWYNSIDDYLEGKKAPRWSEGKDKDGNMTITDGTVTLKVGDYVNYEELVKTSTVDTTQVMSDLATYSGYTGSTYSTDYPLKKEENLKWRVLDVKNGNIRLISEIPTTYTVYLHGYNGYNNAVYLLDEVCNTLYTTDKGKAQNLKIEDIQDAMNLDEEKGGWDYHSFTTSSNVKYDETKEYTSESYRKYPEILKKEKKQWVYSTSSKTEQEGTLDLSEQDELITQQTLANTAGYSINVTHTYWDKYMRESNWKDKTYQNIFIVKKGTTSNYSTYWLSSRYVNADPKYAHFDVRRVGDLTVGGNTLYLSDRLPCRICLLCTPRSDSII